MKSLFSIISLSITLLFSFIACNSTDKSNDETTVEETNIANESTTKETKEVEEEVVEEPVETENNYGNFDALVGAWTVDAATAGVKTDLTFGEDFSFTQKMGVVNGEGTWEVVDAEHIKIVTQNTTGQVWRVTDLTENSVNICWNPDSDKPKILPMEKVQ